MYTHAWMYTHTFVYWFAFLSARCEPALQGWHPPPNPSTPHPPPTP